MGLGLKKDWRASKLSQCMSSPACTCIYEGRTYNYNDVVYNTTDGLGACLVAICKDNGTIKRTTEECPEVPSTTPFTFTTTLTPLTTNGKPIPGSLGAPGL